MRKFWGRQDEEEEPAAEAEDLEDVEEEDADDAAIAENDEEPLEPEIQARVDKLTSQRVEAEVKQYRDAARARGLDWTGNDFGVVDYGRAAQAFGFAGQQQQERAPQPIQQQQDEETDEEPELDEFTYDATQVKAWNAWQVRQATKQLQQENQRLRRMQNEDRLDQAMDRAADAITKHAPHLEALLEHPQFAETFREALATQQPELWRDPKNLARVAAIISVDLNPEDLPKREPAPRDRAGRFTAGEERRRQLERLSPTRGAGNAPEDDLTPSERQSIREGRLESASEARALRSGSFDDYEKFLVKKGGKR